MGEFNPVWNSRKAILYASLSVDFWVFFFSCFEELMKIPETQSKSQGDVCICVHFLKIWTD